LKDKVAKKLVEEEVLPPEFEALKAKYGKHLARAAYRYLEEYVESMFTDKEKER